MRLNNKGFAITTIIYGTLILFLLLASSVLGILSTHKLRIQKLEDYAEDIIQNKEVTCELTTPEGYDTSKVLTIEPSSESGVKYSFDGEKFSSTSTKEVSAVGTYTGYVKNSFGIVNSCSVSINSRKEYSKQSCNRVTYGSWKLSSKELVPLDWCSPERNPSERYCSTETDNGGWLKCSECEDYQNGAWSWDCVEQLGDNSCSELRKYTRTCTASDCGEYGEWGTTPYTKSCSVNVKTRTVYGQAFPT